MKVAVIGIGYVGLPLMLSFAKAGIPVIGIDLDATKVDALNRGESYIQHIDGSDLKQLVKDGLLSASTDPAQVSQVDHVLICVPTPLNQHNEPDLSYVLNTGWSIAPHINKGTTVVLESTTYPGTTEEELKPILEKGSGLKVGEGFFLAYSPEREDPGNKEFGLTSIPKVVGGHCPACVEKAVQLYSKIVTQVVPVSSCAVAEATKLTENIFRSINIALVNELKVIYEAMGIDVWEVIEAAKTKPYGFMPFYPGPGLGGHCIPIDPFYLTWKAKEHGKYTRFIELAGQINTSMPAHVVNRTSQVLNEQKKAVHGSRILILGISYKPDVDDYRESPSFEIMRDLKNMGAEVSYHDPYVPEIGATREYPEFENKQSKPIKDDYDAILLVTHHSEYKTFDFSNFQAPLIDTRSCVTKRPKLYVKA